MRAKAKAYFFDREAGCYRNVGDEFEVPDARFAELANHPEFGALVEKAGGTKPRAARRSTKKTE